MPGAPISTACVEGGRAAGLGRAGGEGGTEIVSLAAEARTAVLSSDSREGICMAKAKRCELQSQYARGEEETWSVLLVVWQQDSLMSRLSHYYK